MERAFLLVAVVLLGLILISSGAVLYSLYLVIKQQGRLLLRLDGIEERLASEGSQAMPAGLAVGTPFPTFKLPDLTGKQVALEDCRGKRVFLVNWNPGCGFCDLIAADLAKLQSDFEAHHIRLVLAARGDAESNRKLAEEHGLKCPILLQKDSQILEALQGLGTPAAYLLDEEGKVAKPLAIGSEQVPALAREAALDGSKPAPMRGNKPLSQSRIERNGLKAGNPAPDFHLPDIYGRTVSLQEFRGRNVLLAFSDPDCGPCDALAPHLVRMHQDHRDNNLAVIMVGRGDPEENRRKAEQHGFEFPVVLQKKWEISKQYGIFDTPVAFLISEEGIIIRNVARGVSEIVGLSPPAIRVRRIRTNSSQ